MTVCASLAEHLGKPSLAAYVVHCVCGCSAITEENVGHKMLAKMGWKEGDSLGKSNAGILEPVSITVTLQSDD